MNATAHNHEQLPFGRKVPAGQCPRCDELRAGAAPRSGWGAAERAFECTRINAIRAHSCTAANCGPVCTAFDW